MGEGGYRHLSFEEREQIAIWRLEAVSQAEMARRLHRSSSTINRELARNRLPSGGYQPSFAEGSYLVRRERAMQHFRRMRNLQMFSAIHASVFNHFDSQRSLTSRAHFKKNRAAALAE